jgi:hypothetical protein
VNTGVQELDGSSDEKKRSNVEVIRTTDSTAEFIAATAKPSARQIVVTRLHK